MKYPLFKKRAFDEFPVVSEAFSSPKREDAFLRLGDQVCGIISLISKAHQFAETQKCVSTIFPRTYVKKIVFLFLLAFTAATQAVGQITFTPSTNINPSKVYKLDAVAEGNSVSASFASLSAQIKSDLGISDIYGGQFYMRWFVRDASETGYENVQKDWKVSFSFSEGKLAETVDYGTAWFSDNFWWTNDETKYYSAAITAPNGVDSKDYQAVCLITNKSGYNLSNDILTEKNIQIAVVFNIKMLDDVLADYPYPDLGSLQKMEETIVYDNDAATIDLSLTDYRNEIPDYNNIKYLHLYLTDKEGRVIPGNAFALKEDNTNPDTKVVSSVAGYHLYYTNQYYGSLFMENNRAQYVVTKPDGSSWENLRVVAVFANSIAGMGTYGDYVISEPSTLTSAFVFSFKSLDESLKDYTLPDISLLPTHEVNVWYEGGTTSAVLDFFSHKDQINTDYKGGTFQRTKYLHFYVVNENGEAISDIYDATFTPVNPSYQNRSAVPTPFGWYVYANGDNAIFSEGGQSDAQFTFRKPADLNWNAIKVVAVLTDDVTGWEMNSGYVLKTLSS